jgi:SNF2 family DNA or RNA helicase
LNRLLVYCLFTWSVCFSRQSLMDAPTTSTHRTKHSTKSFRPVNTLSSKCIPLPSHLDQSLGDTSSLFDSTDGSLELDIDYYTNPSTTRTANITPTTTANITSTTMARERRPSVEHPAQPSRAHPLAHLPSSGATATAPPPPPSTAATKLATQPTFGTASPLRNPLRDPYSNLFNPNSNKPELHRPVPPPAFRPSASGPANGAQAKISSFYLPGQQSASQSQSQHQPQPQSRPAQLGNPLYGNPANRGALRAPINPPLRDIPPAARQVFSSAPGPSAINRPVIAPRPKPIDLTNDDDEDAFDPDAALREDRFGAADPYAYIDPGQTSHNIKALLEGAFDEDDADKPKMRLRKRIAKKEQKVKPEKKISSLEDKLKQLELDAVKDETKEQDKHVKEDDEEDEEDGTVEGLTIKLLPHQVEGVSWMIDKEIGQRKKNGVLPKGGILADDMGLGKTVQSVSLILLNPRPELDAKPPPENPKRKMPHKDVGKGTLVVAPLALIRQWEAEIKTKVHKDHALRVLVHHGPSRTKYAADLKKYDVVITTYQILASEFAGSSDHADGAKVGCYGVHWYRVILDEAHSIKNRSAKSTQATYGLRSWYRWCLTGTPMQNNLDELQSLICFLQIKPYNNLATWKEQITLPMKNGKGHYAIKRIQYFLKGFMKRRTKDILKEDGALSFGGKSKTGEKKSTGMQIVERRVETVICELDPRERDFYDQLQERAQKRLDDMMGGEKTDYIGALVLLLRLRQACNHPKLVSGSMGKDKDALSTGQPAPSQTPRKTSASYSQDNEVDALADMFGGMDVQVKDCDICSVRLLPAEVKAGALRCSECEDIAKATPKRRSKKEKREKKHKPKAEPAPVASRGKNRKIVVDSDDEDDEGEGDWLVDESQQNTPGLGRAGGTDDEDAEGGGETLGSIDSASEDDDSQSESDTESEEEGEGSTGAAGAEAASTKIRRLLRILHAETPEHKTIVFSQFTSMLDLIEPHLKKAAIRYVRYDGGMRNDAREASLNSLRNDPKTRVLLCSLKCGSLGLNLTAASRVVLIEPFWNPFVEEQAIDRVHRLNQTVDVHVYKLTVGNTVEERIIELQEKKRELAKAAIEGGKAVAKLTMKDIMSLFGHNPDAVGGRESIGDSDGKRPWDQNTKVLNAASSRPGAAPTARQSGSEPMGSSAKNSPPVRNDRRGGYEKDSRRIRNEDPVYGRR